MYLDSKTRQRLLELVYDALPDDEATALWRLIENDLEMARAYADARRTAGLVAEAAQIKAPNIERSRREQVAAIAGLSRTTAAGRAALRRRPPGGRGADLTVGLAAAILLLISIGTLFMQRGQWADLAAEHFRLLLTGPARFQAGAANHFSLLTTGITGEPVSAQIETTLSTGSGKELLCEKAWTDRGGRLELALSADVQRLARVQLSVSAAYRGKTESATMPLGVEPIRYDTRLELDKPRYRAGEPVYYRSTTLARFSLAAAAEFPLQFAVLGPDDALVPGSMLSGTTEQGIGNGAFRLPENLAPGNYRLVAKSPDASLPARQRTFVVEPQRGAGLTTALELARDRYRPGDTVVADFSARKFDGSPLAAALLDVAAVVGGRNVYRSSLRTSAAGTAKIRFPLPEKIDHPGDARLTIGVASAAARETVRRDIPLQGSAVSVAFYPESGQMVAGLDNRIYFTARDERGRPVDLRGSILDDRGNEILDVESSYLGMGLFTLAPDSGEHYHLKITSPAGIEEQPRLPDDFAEHGVLLTTGPGVFDAGQPLQITVRSLRPNLPLLLAASCRGMPVGQYAFVAAASANRLTLPLAGEVGGVIRLTVYDYRAAPPQPLAERLVYRRPGRRLQLRPGDDRPWYATGEKVKLALSVSNEKGQPAPATLAAAVANAATAVAGGDSPAQLLLAEALDPAQERDDAEFLLGDSAQASLALDLLLGSRAAPRSAAAAEDQPPLLSDNLSQIRAKYEESVGRYRERRSWVPEMFVDVSFFGGFALTLLVAMMAILNIITGVRIWMPALIVAVACLVIGAILMNPDRLGEGRADVVAFQPFSASLSGDKAATTPAAGQAGPPGAAPIEKPPNRENRKIPATTPAGSGSPAPTQFPRFPICQYAHAPAGAGDDSTAPVAWYPLLTAGRDGRAHIAFELPGDPAGYRLRAEARLGGRLGVVEAEIRARRPLALQTRLPEELTAGDRFQALASVLNQTAQALSTELTVVHDAHLTIDENAAPRKITIPGQQQVEESIAFLAASPAEACLVEFRAVAGSWSDGVTRKLRIAAPGMPVERAFSGLLEGSSQVTVELPPQWVPGSLEVALLAFPSVLAELRQAADGLAGDPSIGLEQAINANFVNALILQYLEEQAAADPGLMKEAKQRLRAGLERLAAIESPDGGLAAFRGAPEEESLSAYGLMQWSLASRVHNVERPPIDRLAAWLMRRSDGLGGFRHNASALNGVCPPQADVVNTYITWALALCGEKAITAELQKARETGQASDAPYVVALAALGLLDSGHGDEIGRLLDKLAQSQQRDGHLNAGDAAKFPNQGGVLDVEATALAALAWIGSANVTASPGQAIAWLAGKRDARGGFGSPRATILALRAISEYARRHPRPAAAGTISVKCRGKAVAERSFAADRDTPIVIDGLAAPLVAGSNPLTLSLTAGVKLPYVLAIKYHLRRPVAPSQCPISLSAAMGARRVEAGGRVTLMAEIANPTAIEQPLTIAVLGIPAGLEVQQQSLEQLRREGVLDGYQVWPRQVICGWRTMAAGRHVAVKLDLTAVASGQFTAPPSCVYLDQVREDKRWIEPLSVAIGGL